MVVNQIVYLVGLRREARLTPGPASIGVTGLGPMLRNARAVVSFGLCGALDPALRAGDLVIGEAVVFQGGRLACDPRLVAVLAAALPGARLGAVAGVERIVEGAAEKAALYARTGAVAADMESLGAASAGLPFVVLRAVSDAAHRTLPRSAIAGFSASGEPDVGAVMRALARRSWELPALIRTALEAEAGFRALARAAPELEASAVRC